MHYELFIPFMITNYLEISPDNPVISKIEQLYLDSFPADERREFDAVKRLLGDPDSAFKIVAAMNGDDFVGFFGYWEWNDMRYIEHFAVDPQKRGGGIGKKMLADFAALAKSPIILEVEPPLTDIAARRIGFYKRCGYMLHDNIKYVQPPYDPSKQSLDLYLMTKGEIELSENSEFIKRIKKEVYGVENL